MAGPRIVTVNGGRVTSRDPAMLGDGEVVTATDAYYKPNDPGLWSLLGRTRVTAATDGNSILGLRILGFDSASDRLVVLSGTKYRSGVLSRSGEQFSCTLADLITGLSGAATTLDSVQFDNEHYLLNGADRNRVVASAGTARYHGMLEATAAPIEKNEGVGAGFTLSAGKTITYWVEERVKDASGNILRRNGESGTHVVTLTGTGGTLKPQFYATATNPDATHWALFATATDGTFPVGAEIGEAVFGAFIEDTRTTADPGLPGGETYETVQVTLAGLTQLYSKNGPAPIASTGDLLKESMLLNDVSNPRRVWVSYPSNPDAFPYINYIDFNTKEHDNVKVIKTLSDTTTIVLLEDSAWRIDDLPKFSDDEFSPQDFRQQVDGAFGVVNAKAAALFSFGDGQRLAYVSVAGIVVLDATRWDVLTDDLEWKSEVNLDYLDRIRLVNNISDYRLEMTYVPFGETNPDNTKTMFLHYHPSQAKTSPAGGLRAKLTWPINRDARSSDSARPTSRAVVFSGSRDGHVYQHDIGATDAAGQTIRFDVLSGEVYTNFVGGHSRILRLLTRHDASEQEATVTLVCRNPGDPDEVQPRQISLARREATPSHGQVLSESTQAGLTKESPTSQIRLAFFGLDFEAAGQTEG